MTISNKSKVSGGALEWSQVVARNISDFIFLSYYTIHIPNIVYFLERNRLNIFNYFFAFLGPGIQINYQIK